MINFAATITTTKTVRFYETAVNNGTINGNVEFNDTSRNGDNGTINGNADFGGCSANNGAVNGEMTYNRANAKDCPGYIVSDPPLKASWITLSYSGWLTGANYQARRLVAYPSRNVVQFEALGLSPYLPLSGPWQFCPEDGCFAHPALYRPFAPFDFVIDYEEYPQYLEAPGNPE